MPKTKDKLPAIGMSVKFRIEGDKHLHEGTYTEEGFKACLGFVCYTTCEVDYWRPMTTSTDQTL
jgi:hypothetical protein